MNGNGSQSFSYPLFLSRGSLESEWCRFIRGEAGVTRGAGRWVACTYRAAVVVTNSGDGCERRLRIMITGASTRGFDLSQMRPFALCHERKPNLDVVITLEQRPRGRRAPGGRAPAAAAQGYGSATLSPPSSLLFEFCICCGINGRTTGPRRRARTNIAFKTTAAESILRRS
ncbi:hypothetical protein EVAR_76240_1 [Eumeta japonica]|uniref:Uncharacterized protein n=1 Tax=Eumeta variegata TaxID=151549 RepID=A0A4C1UNW7_EUMVA|nr:hypothetical protein EVAR_76240_1 [Eumeta japonica]